jgi:hypothetical protein
MRICQERSKSATSICGIEVSLLQEHDRGRAVPATRPTRSRFAEGGGPASLPPGGLCRDQGCHGAVAVISGSDQCV